MHRVALFLAGTVLAVAACQESGPAALDQSSELTGATGPVVNHASIGGADGCEALGLPTGCDANFSLVANLFADGSVNGQWQDAFRRSAPGEGIHVAVDCLHVVGTGAVVGGVITKGIAFGVDVSGQRALTAIVDNGTSASDPPDQLSFSFFPTGGDCTQFVPGDFALFNLTHGQVTVR